MFPAVLGNAAARFTKAAMMTCRRKANTAKAARTVATQHKNRSLERLRKLSSHVLSMIQVNKIKLAALKRGPEMKRE